MPARAGRLLGGLSRLARRTQRQRLNMQAAQNARTVEVQNAQLARTGQQSQQITKNPGVRPPNPSRVGTLVQPPQGSRTGTLRGSAGGGTNVLTNEGGGPTLTSVAQAGNTASAGNTNRATPNTGSPANNGDAGLAARLGAKSNRASIEANQQTQTQQLRKKKKGTAPGSLSQAAV